MQTTNTAPMVIGPFFYGLSALLKTEGINTKAFYKKQNINEEIEKDDQQLVPFKTLINCLESVRKVSKIKHPGLYIAERQVTDKIFSYFNLILSAPTLEVALQISRRFRYLYSEVAHWDWQLDDDYSVVKLQSFAPLRTNCSEFILLTIGKVFLLIKHLLSGAECFKRISLIQPKDKHSHEIERFFNCPVSFAQDFDGYILKANYLYVPNKNFQAQKYHDLLHSLVNQTVIFPQNQQFSTFVKILILQMLGTGLCTLKMVAKQIGMSPRAVQKRLLKEDLTFKALVLDVRMNVAKRLLSQQDVSLIQISSMLGYSEASAFSRAFKIINQCSPRTWRNNIDINSN